MKQSRKIGLRAFYLLFILIIVFTITELIKPFIPLGMDLEAWKLALGTATGLLVTVWTGVATKNFRKNKNV